jgi:pyridoxamine 5'-phosphate oxidase
LNKSFFPDVSLKSTGMKKSIADIRKEYSGHGLHEKEMQEDPIRQFDLWMDEALETSNREPTAMTLATADSMGHVSARMVLLKRIAAKGFYFFSHYQSLKARQLENNPRAALLFYSPELERQVRIEGTVQKIPSHESDDYFRRRPEGSQLSTWASPQSRRIPDADYVRKRYEMYKQRFHDGPVLRPDFWGGYCLRPTLIEFWQDRADRLHDRIRYRQTDGRWIKERLAS